MDENMNTNTETQQTERKAYEQAPPPPLDRQGNPANAYEQPQPQPQPQPQAAGTGAPQGGPGYAGGYQQGQGAPYTNNGYHTGGPTYTQGQHGYSDGMTPHSGVHYQAHYEARVDEGADGRAWASMVLGIISLLTCCCIPCISVICSIVGLILGIICLKDRRPGSGLAIAGIVCSGLSLFMLGISLLIFALNSLNGNFEYGIKTFPPFEGFDGFRGF